MVLRGDTVVSEGHSSGRTHVFRSSIAFLTGGLRLSVFLPRVPAFRMSQRCEQSFARSTKSFSLIILSYPSFNSSTRCRSVEILTHPNQGEQGAGGTQDSLDWEDLDNIFGSVQDVDGRIQCRNILRSIISGASRPRLENVVNTHALVVNVERKWRAGGRTKARDEAVKKP